MNTKSPVTPQSNIPEYTVSELASSIKKSLESGYAHIRVRGELSRVKIHSSGHMYSALKDDTANLDVVCWKGTLNRMPLHPEEGLEVICTGRISSYPARSNYQLVIEHMELAGEGALLKMLEQRRKKLAAEGLFDPARKKPLPFLPEIIGVVTSPTGAVIRDIMHRIRDRFPRPVYLWPVIVQGDGAADQITQAIHGFNRLPAKPKLRPNSAQKTPGSDIKPYRPDILIVGRGGGSLEDLMPFNEENLVRAVASSDIPIISAVGHETDTTLCDHAADLRAPTPTAAAEKAVPNRLDLYARLHENGHRLYSAMNRDIDRASQNLKALTAGLGDPRRYIEVKIQQFDHITERLNHSFGTYLTHKKSKLIEISSQLSNPRQKLDNAYQSLISLDGQLTRAGLRITQPKSDQLQSLARILESLSYQRVLDRGYVVVRDENGTAISNPANITTNQNATLSFKGNQNITAILNPNTISEETSQASSPTKTIKRKARKEKAGNPQQDLF